MGELFALVSIVDVSNCLDRATGGLIFAAIKLHRQLRREWMLALTGVPAIALGVVLAVQPGAGALAMTLWIGAWSIVIGVLTVGLGFQVRKLERSGTGGTPTLQSSS